MLHIKNLHMLIYILIENKYSKTENEMISAYEILFGIK